MTNITEYPNGGWKVNPDYTHFVVNKMTGNIVSGWEYKEDAIESMNEFNEWDNHQQYKIASKNQHPVDPFNLDNWSNS